MADVYAGRKDRPEPSTLRIRLFGGLVVERAGLPVSAREWQRASVPKLLSLLVLHPEGLSRDEAGEALWPDRDPTGSEAALRTALSILRRVLEAPSGREWATSGRSERLARSEHRLRLHLLPDDWVDVNAFATPEDLTLLDVKALTDLADLYCGPLLPELIYEDWTEKPRERWRGRWHTMSLLLARRLAARGSEAEGVRRLEAVLADDPTQEEAARALMSLLVEEGRGDEALRLYQRTERALRDDLDLPPDDLTDALAARIRRSEPVRPARSREKAAAVLRRRMDELVALPPSADVARRLARVCADLSLLMEKLHEPEAALADMKIGMEAIAAFDFPIERARLLLAEAMARGLLSESQRILNAAEEAERLAADAGEWELVAWALRLQAQALPELGRGDEANAHAQRSADLYDERDAPEQALLGRRIVAHSTWRSGRLREAEMLDRRALAEARDSGNPEQIAYALCNLGAALLAQGMLDGAEPLLGESLALASTLEERYLILADEYHLANLWAERAYLALEPDCAPSADCDAPRIQTQTRFERLLRLARLYRSYHITVFAAVDYATALNDWGDTSQARDLVGQAWDALAQLPDAVSARGWTHLTAAEIDLAGGCADAAWHNVAAAIPLLQEASKAGLARAYRTAAVTCERRGEANRAATYWQASIDAAGERGQRLEALRTEHAKGAHATLL